jgi:hypothetical protein
MGIDYTAVSQDLFPLSARDVSHPTVLISDNCIWSLKEADEDRQSHSHIADPCLFVAGSEGEVEKEGKGNWAARSREVVG